MKNNRGIFIAVEGTIGVGKTTLANILTENYKAVALREIVEENPFLSKFYTDISEYALQTEAFFLFNRIKQLEDTEKNHLTNGEMVVSDYHIVKNLIFAGITLNSLNRTHFYNYKQMYNTFVNELPQPDVVIYLHSETDVLMKRIAMRDRSFERKMDRNYIDELNGEYKYYFSPRSIKHNFMGKAPIVLNIDNSNLDFLNKDEDRQYIIGEVDKAIEKIRKNRNV